MEFGYLSEAPMCADHLEAITYWLRYGRFVPRSFAAIATAESGFKTFKPLKSLKAGSAIEIESHL
jgi:hypothetical protein